MAEVVTQVETHLCSNNADNAAAANVLQRLRTLRTDSNHYGELLATLCLPRNRESIRRGDAAALDELFDLIDTYAEGHKNRLSCIG